MRLFLSTFIILMSACSTSPVIKSDGHTYKVIEGRFEQFVKDLHWEKSETTGYTHVTTTISKWDTTFDPKLKASGIHARASRTAIDGSTTADVKFSVNDVKYTNDFRTDGRPKPGFPAPHYTAYILEADETVNVDFLGHFSGQYEIEYYEWEEFSIPLSPSFIEEIRALKAMDDEKFIGEPINIEFYRDGFEDIQFKILPSEILAAIHGLESGTICDPEYDKRTSSRYTYLCPAIIPQ